MTALTKFKQFNWGGGYCGILDIPTEKFTTLGGGIHKYSLESDGNFTLSILKDYVGVYVLIPSREAHNDAILFKSIINSLSSEGKCKVYNQSDDFHTLGEESGVLLIKTIPDESVLHDHATAMKEKAVLTNLP